VGDLCDVEETKGVSGFCNDSSPVVEVVGGTEAVMGGCCTCGCSCCDGGGEGGRGWGDEGAGAVWGLVDNSSGSWPSDAARAASICSSSVIMSKV
jgi:hypothetical protein